MTKRRLYLICAICGIFAGVALALSGVLDPKPVEVEDAAQEQVSEQDQVESTTLVKVDMDAPDFTVEMLSGEKVSLSDLRGKVVLLNFWATWCPPCREELTHVQTDIIEKFEGRDFVFLPISRGEKRADVEKFMTKMGYTFPAGLDESQSIYKLYASNYIPRNFLINRHGVVVATSVGFDEEEFKELQQRIDMSLNAR